MSEFITINKDNIEELVGRISEAFHYPPGAKVSRDFPLLYSSNNFQRLIAAGEGGKMEAHAGFYPSILKVENIGIRVAGIGGVFTDPKAQGKGYASKLVEECCARAKKEGAALAFLWTDKHEFYRRLGFELVGRQWSIHLSLSRADVLEDLARKDGSRRAFDFREGADTSFLLKSFSLFENYTIGNKRRIDEHNAYLTSKGCRVFGAWEGENLAAYCVLGKGLDLEGYVHEWAGDEGALHALLAHCLKTMKRDLVVLSPQFMPEECSWIYTLDENGFAMDAGYMAMVKILDLQQIKKLLEMYMESLGLKKEDLKILKQDERYSVGWRDGAWKANFSEPEFLRFLFGPDMPSSAELKAFLPMRLWYWGMDSV